MSNIFIKSILILLFLLTTNGIRIIKKKIINLQYIINKNKQNSNAHKNIYKELLELYFENKQKFYARGRDYLLNRNGTVYNESNSMTFKDKLNYLLIYESPEDKTNIVDKILLRNYSQKVLGKNICTPILKIYDDIDQINLDELPDKFVLKCNHGSAMNIFCENKTNFDLPKAKYLLKQWMNINYGLFSFEYQYLNIKKRVFSEKFLGKEIINYKFSCFNGEPKIIRVKGKINGTNLYNIYYTNWTITNFELRNKKYVLSNIFKKPVNLKKMIKYAHLLSSGFCYCRVDFYEVNKTLYILVI
jgi:hypothetical protein